MKRAVTNSGRANVMSRSRHSCSECLGGSKTWSASSSLSWPVKSSIGEMSRRTSATPSSMNQLERLALDRDQVGQLERPPQLGEGQSITGRETNQQSSLQRTADAAGQGEIAQQRHERRDTASRILALGESGLQPRVYLRRPGPLGLATLCPRRIRRGPPRVKAWSGQSRQTAHDSVERSPRARRTSSPRRRPSSSSSTTSTGPTTRRSTTRRTPSSRSGRTC